MSTGFIGCREGRVGNSQIFCEGSYPREAEMVLGSTPAATPGASDHPAIRPQPRQQAAIPSAALARSLLIDAQ